MTGPKITPGVPGIVFVFGSNLAGRHGKGAALDAIQRWGAKYGQGVGRQGQSYAIPTKDKSLKTLTLARINVYVQQFLDYARAHPDDLFQVTQIGCGLAGYVETQIAPMFKYAPAHCHLPRGWRDLAAASASRCAERHQGGEP